MPPYRFRMALLPRPEYLVLKKLKAEILKPMDSVPVTQKDVIATALRISAEVAKEPGGIERLQGAFHAYKTTAPSKTEALL